MGISSDGQLCFGILLTEEQLPWDEEGYDGFDDWWLNQCGYKPPFQMFDERGHWLNGVKPPEERLEAYFAHRRAFEDTHPCPVVLVTHCSYEYPMYIIALPGTDISAWRGHPKKVDKLISSQPADEEIRVLESFVETYLSPEHIEDFVAGWWLSSLYG